MLDTACDDSLSVFSRNSMALMVSQPMIKDHSMHLSGATSNNNKCSLDQGKYVRYTADQVQALERLYNECPKPSSLRRQQLVRDFPILQNIEPKQIKVWFQNRRCREKQRKETSRLQTVNSKLTAMNKLLMEENDRLQKQVAQLLYENGYIRQQLQHGGITTDTSCDSVVTSGLQHLPTHQQQSPLQEGSYAGIMSLAEETLAEFLSKATGTAIEWIQMPGMKPGPDSMSMVNISHGSTGVAARACGLINLEPPRIADAFKDKPSWHRECRRMMTMFSTSTSGGGILEVLYVQMYAPTTLANPKDFYTLRYTSVSDDGSYVVCERSLNAAHAAPMIPQTSSFVRAEMHASGCLIRPCETSGSLVIIIDHMDLESWSVPEVLRPLYESSASLAHKLTIAALKHLRHIAQEAALDAPGGGQQPAAVRSLSHRIAKGFNDAVNGFLDDGWSPVPGDGMDDVTVMVKHPVNSLTLHQSTSTNSSILCAKASMLLQNVPPAFLVRFMREHRSEWADHGCEEAMRMNNPAFSGFHASTSNSQLLQPQVHAIEEDEFLELIKMEGQSCLAMQDQTLIPSPQDMFLLQLCSGLEDNGSGACAQMVFAPIDASVSDDIALIPSGFRVIPLDHSSRDQGNGSNSGRTLDLASTLEVGNATASSSGQDGINSRLSACGGGNPQAIRSVLTIAFQFSYIETRMHESVACIARQYVRSVVSSVQRVAMAFISSPPPPRQLLNSSSSLRFTPSSPGPHYLQNSNNSPTSQQAQLSLARCVCQSYKMNVGVDLVQVEDESNEAYLHALNKLEDALLCCSCKPVPTFTFANQAGLDMLEISSMSVMALQDFSLEKTLDEDSNKNICSFLSQVMQQGYACLSEAGVRLSSTGRPARFERAIAWRVAEEEEVRGVAFLYMKWCLV